MGLLLHLGEAGQAGEGATLVVRRRLSAAAHGPVWP
jgi:hypothetical protein